MGERVGVIGLGLVGQLALRILLAAGCDGVGIDVDRAAVELAAETGALTFIRDDPALERSDQRVQRAARTRRRAHLRGWTIG